MRTFRIEVLRNDNGKVEIMDIRAENEDEAVRLISKVGVPNKVLTYIVQAR